MKKIRNQQKTISITRNERKDKQPKHINIRRKIKKKGNKMQKEKTKRQEMKRDE